jgi:predicted Zn-dependent protease
MARATFEAASEEGTVRGEAAFLRYDDLTYRLLGYATASAWSGYASAVGATLQSFAPVTDPNVLGVEPLRLDIVRLDRAMSLTSFVQGSPQPVDIDVLARLNRVEPGEVISAGTRIKTVSGTPVGR